MEENSGVPPMDWTPLSDDRRYFIARPASPYEFRPISVDQHHCTLEYRRVDGLTLRREIVILHVRQSTRTVLVVARTVGGAPDDIPEYRLHRIIALIGSDGIRMPPIDYLRTALGIWIE